MTKKKKGQIVEGKGVAHIPLFGGKGLGMLEEKSEEPVTDEEKDSEDEG